MDEFPFSALFLFAQSCLTDAVNVIFSDYCFTDTYLKDRAPLPSLPRQLLHPLNGEGREGHWLHGDRHQLSGVVVCRHPVGGQRPAPAAAVDDGPFAAPAHPDRDRFHDAAAVRGPVSGFNIHMEAGQAVGAVVSVTAPRPLGGCQPTAHPAGEAVAAGMGFVITFFVLLTLVFSIQGIVLLKDMILLGGLGDGLCRKPPGQATITESV